MPKQKEITYPNALAPNGKVVNVNDPEFQDRTMNYKCLGCGEPMSAVHKTKGRSYFRHINANPGCNEQTYLHRLAKRRFKEMFDSGNPFLLTYKSQVACRQFKECSFRKEGEERRCMRDGVRTVDLNTLYDTCREEAGCRRFVADLLLTSSTNPDREPLLLEIAVTHVCDDEKIASGLQIVEVAIRTEEDICLPLTEGETADGRTVTLYNFNRAVHSEDIFGMHTVVRSTVVDTVRGLRYKKDIGTCKQVISTHYPNSVIEMICGIEDFGRIGEHEFQKLTLARLSSLGVHPRICMLCRHAYRRNPETNRIEGYNCKIAKAYLLETCGCRDWAFDGQRAKDLLEKYRDLRLLYWVRPKKSRG